MNYQEFKKSAFRSLTGLMSEIGFQKGANNTPTYWCFPSDDPRLVWVVCFDFSVRGNPYFDILIGPYWMGYRLPSAGPFPRCVSYSSRVGTAGIQQGTTWHAEDAVFVRAVEVIRTQGLAYLSKFKTPEELLAAQPNGLLAFDMGRFELAKGLLERALQHACVAAYTRSTLSKAGQKLHDENLALVEDRLRSTVDRLGTADLDLLMSNARHMAAQSTLNYCKRELDRDPSSRWLKQTIKQCQKDMELHAPGVASSDAGS
ncbi:hypothetical protein DBR42_25215 [Pelomonas sp. HMWF004]|nr:hypothetical protein DBR42_25215 [Pelomonas sp. HMWF004]